MNIYRGDAIPNSDDEPTLPSIPVVEQQEQDDEEGLPFVGWWRALLDFVLLEEPS